MMARVMPKGRPFSKGKSGNPGGRSEAQVEMQELARQHGPEALMRLVEIMRGEDVKAAVAAADKILDRGYGKASQPVDGDGDGGPIRIEVCWQGEGEAA